MKVAASPFLDNLWQSPVEFIDVSRALGEFSVVDKAFFADCDKYERRPFAEDFQDLDDGLENQMVEWDRLRQA